jgi:fumarylacetoacetase
MEAAMNYAINDTHDPSLKSWVPSAQTPGADFPIQNLPFGVFARLEGKTQPHVGVGIGDCVLDLFECGKQGMLADLPDLCVEASASDSLNALMALGPDCWSALRKRISMLLRTDSSDFRRMPAKLEAVLVPMNETRMLLPARIGDYTDFYASIHHARNVGSMFRPENPLLPNYKYVPVGYHGRASSIIVSGTTVHRPSGQTEGPNSVPVFGPCRLLDYELEIGAFIGPGNPLGCPIGIADAESHLFGLCLLNDWSARDIQKWEYQPLGPFLGKSFATSVSPWIVTMEALAPFRIAAPVRDPGDPPALPYLTGSLNIERGGIDLGLEVRLRSEQMRRNNQEPVLLSRSNLRDLYWTLAQMVVHQTSNGCNLREGDLLGSGTVSGPDPKSRGCLLELTWRGSEPVALPTGEARRFLEDGDEVIFRGRAERKGCASIGFGECRGIVRG